MLQGKSAKCSTETIGAVCKRFASAAWQGGDVVIDTHTQMGSLARCQNFVAVAGLPRLDSTWNEEIPLLLPFQVKSFLQTGGQVISKASSSTFWCGLVTNTESLQVNCRFTPLIRQRQFELAKTEHVLEQPWTGLVVMESCYQLMVTLWFVQSKHGVVSIRVEVIYAEAPPLSLFPWWGSQGLSGPWRLNSPLIPPRGGPSICEVVHFDGERAFSAAAWLGHSLLMTRGLQSPGQSIQPPVTIHVRNLKEETQTQESYVCAGKTDLYQSCLSGDNCTSSTDLSLCWIPNGNGRYATIRNQESVTNLAMSMLKRLLHSTLGY